MKNISVIVLLVALFFALVLSAYVIGFNLCFSSSRLINSTKHLFRMTFQRNIKISGMSFSPFGSFKVRSFSMAAKGGFENGSQLSVNKLSAKVNLKKLLRRELYVGELFIDGVKLNLNYENSRKFNYALFFSNVKYILMKDGKRIGLLKKAEVKNMEINNASVDLATDRGTVKFKNISLLSGALESGDNFDGNVSFDFEYGEHRYEASFKFNYNAGLNTISISEFKCGALSLYAVGDIVLLENGEVGFSFKIDGDRLFFDGILKNLTGKDYLEGHVVASGTVSGVDVSYPASVG